MKHYLISGIMALMAWVASAALPPQIENPECLGINKQPYHATLMPYASLEQALGGKRMESPYCILLNGTWKFHWVKHPDERPLDFYQPGFDVSSWTNIPVPSNWEAQGYGTPHYRNSGYILQKDFPRVMTDPPTNFTAFVERNPVGSYRRDFELPRDWAGRRVFLTFCGVDSAFFVWINGKQVGYSVNSRNPAEFDVTPFVTSGRNMVAVEVYRFSSGTWFEDQDMWRLSGIFRDCYLWSAPAVHIRDFFALPDLDVQYKDATLTVHAKVKNFGTKPATARQLTASVFDKAGKLACPEATGDVPALAPGAESTVTLKLAVPQPAKWSAETPNLYTTVLKLDNGEEFLSCHTGFRKIELKDRLFLVNGVPVKLKGANRHEMDPYTGHTVSEASMIRDLELLKQGNCNHVRTSHYTDHPRWYELCDEWGLYLCAEANVETHGYSGGPDTLAQQPTAKAAHVDRNIANVENLKNHASVIMWSLGNESGSGTNLVAALQAVKALDTSRPAHYQGFGTGPRNPADIDSVMYPTWQSLERRILDKAATKPFYLCEYAHAMNNSMGALGEYNDMFDKYPALMGGAIWEWEDQGLWNLRNPQRPILAYGGGFGEVPNDKYFIHKGVVFSDRSPKPHFPEMKKVYQWVTITADDLAAGKVKIRNRYAFLNLERFAGAWTISGDGQVIARGELPKLQLAPGAETSVTLPLPPFKREAGVEYFLRVAFMLTQEERWARSGHEIAWQQFLLPGTAPVPVVAREQMPPVALKQDGTTITVSGKGFAVIVDKATGFMRALERDGRNLLAGNGGPRLHLWRAAHKIDDMWAYGTWSRYGVLRPTSKLLSLSVEPCGPSAVRITVSQEVFCKQDFGLGHVATYTVYGDGSIVVDNSVTPWGKQIPLARLGVRLLLDPALDRFSYLGRGPMENYADRKRGSDIGLFSGTVRDNLTPYAKPMECGNHEDVRWAAVTDNRGAGLMAQAKAGEVLQASSLPYTDEQMDVADYSVDLPPVTTSALVLATRTTGVGSAGCGPHPDEDCIVRSVPATFSYVLRLLPPGSDQSRLGRLQPPADRLQPVLARLDPAGNLVIECATPGVTLEYALADGTWQAYHGPVAAPTALEVKVRATASGLPAFSATVLLNKPHRRSTWKATASSFEPGTGDPANALDLKDESCWVTLSSKGGPKQPHWIVVDFGQTLKISAVMGVPRQDNKPEGRIKDYEIYLSADGQSWGDPVAKGTWENRGDERTAMLAKPASGRYLKLVALNGQTRHGFVTLANLDVREVK